MRADIVVDLGFGDSGKGLAVDHLVATATGPALVIRYCGGHQAGHTVRRPGFTHTFSSFGAGTLRGAPTWFSEHTVVFPPATLLEYDALARFQPRLFVHPLAQVATPCDIAWNHALDAHQRHGSCGVGFGATVERGLAGCPLFALDLACPWVLRHKLAALRGYYDDRAGRAAGAVATAYHQALRDYEEERFVARCRGFLDVARLARLDELATAGTHLIFEGAQGVLLDQHHGVFPHVTWADTTSRQAWAILRDDLPGGRPADVALTYVTRCYQTRHGAGPMSGAPVKLVAHEGETNVANPHQGPFRTTDLDPALLRHALRAERSRHPPGPRAPETLLVTCLDHRPGFDVAALLRGFDPPFARVLVCDSPFAESVRPAPASALSP